MNYYLKLKVVIEIAFVSWQKKRACRNIGPITIKQVYYNKTDLLQENKPIAEKKQAGACFNANDYAIVKWLFGYKYKNV
jgi:hypothetical protein